MDVAFGSPDDRGLPPGSLETLPTKQNAVLESFMEGFGSELWRVIARLKNVDNVALGDDQTTIASGATTIMRNAEVGLDDEDWDDERVEDRDLIGIEFDKRVDRRSESELDQLVTRTEESLWPAFFLRYELDRRNNNRYSD